MSKILEIFGKGITVNTSEVVWAWVNQIIGRQEDQEDSHELNEIIEHLHNRELVQAEQQLQMYLMHEPGCLLGRMIAASYYLLENKLNEAIGQAQSVYLRQPSNTMALYLLGYCHERLGQIEQAMEFYQDCVKFKSYLQLPRQRMAAIHLKVGHLEQAIHEYEMLTTEHPEDVSCQVLLGYLYLCCGKHNQAVDTFNLAILSHPDNYLSTQDDPIESIHVQNGEFERAIENVKELIEQMGPLPDLIIRMADIYDQWDREPEAIACYEYAVKIQPNSLEATIKLGTHYLRKNRFLLAAEQFNRAAEINDEILDAYLGLAIAQMHGDDVHETLQTLYLAGSILQNSVMLFTESAMLGFQAAYDDHLPQKTLSDREVVTIDDVLKTYQKQLQAHKDYPDIHYKYGLLMFSEKNLPVAISAFRNTLQYNPTHYRAHHKLAICLFESQEKQKALDVLKENQLDSNSDFEKYYQVALLFADKAAFANAMRKFDGMKATSNYEKNQVQENIEILLENLGLIDRTDVCWERIQRASKSLIQIKDACAVSDFLSELSG